MTHRRGGAMLAPGVVVMAAVPARAAAEELRTAPTRPGVTQSFRLVRPPTARGASVVLFAGGDGRLDVARRGPGWVGGNVLVRIRGLFAGRGLLVAVVDAPSDRGERDLADFRTSREHVQDIAAVIAELRKIALVVWAVGTSTSTVSGRWTT